MIIPNNISNLLIRSHSPPPTLSSSPASTDSDWRDVTMETESDSSPPITLQSSSIILSPPPAFADVSAAASHPPATQEIYSISITPVKSSANYITPVNSSANYITPVNSSANYITPVKCSTNYITPVNSSANYITPVNSSANYITPVNSSANYITPVKCSTNYITPPHPPLDHNDLQPSIAINRNLQEHYKRPVSAVPSGYPLILPPEQVLNATDCTVCISQSSSQHHSPLQSYLSPCNPVHRTLPASFNAAQPAHTPSVLLTDSVHIPSALLTESVHTPSVLLTDSVHTPSILITDSVMGDSSMKTPTVSFLQQFSQFAQKKSPSIPLIAPVSLTQTHDRLPFQTVVDRCRWSHICSVTALPGAGQQLINPITALDDTMQQFAQCTAYMDSVKSREKELSEELQSIKGQFFNLLDDLGLSHDIYYSAQTPADTRSSSQIRSICLPTQTPKCSSSRLEVRFSGEECGMSTSSSTPRRRPVGRQQAADNMQSLYADLLIQQLLAQAQTDSSDTSNSPPDADNVRCEACLPVSNGHTSCLSDNSHSIPGTISNTADQQHPVNKDSSTDTFPPSSVVLYPDIRLLGQSVSSSVGEENAVCCKLLADLGQQRNDSLPQPASSSTSSSTSVPDLAKELVSRIEFYSDFTIDRQKKIDGAVDIVDMNDENSPPMLSEHSNDENSPPMLSEHSTESLLERCVEGSESSHHYYRPSLSVLHKPLPTACRQAIPRKTTRKHISRKNKQRHHSSDVCESDTSSGTGSMPASQQCSHSSSRHTSKRSLCNHTSSSRTSHSSQGSRGCCSTHPLASSTLISDPSTSGSQKSGSICTWSLENSFDDNLQHSFLLSEKRQHRLSCRPHSASKFSHSHQSTSSQPGRPATLIGADSPPDGATTLHLTHLLSMINSPSLQFGGSSYENGIYHLPNHRSSSLPRSSTRTDLFSKRDIATAHKTSSNPELSSPKYLELRSAEMSSSVLSKSSQWGLVVSGNSVLSVPYRPELPGKSSTSESTNSCLSQCSACKACPLLVAQSAKVNVQAASEDILDEILTNSPGSFDSSGVYPPCNSYTSPTGSTSEYITISDSSWEQTIADGNSKAGSKSSVVFKVPLIPPARTAKSRKTDTAGYSTHNVGVRAVCTPHLPLGLMRHREGAVTRRKLFSSAPPANVQTGNNYRTPKIIDRKALVRKFKKFSSHFKKDKNSAKIQTLANL